MGKQVEKDMLTYLSEVEHKEGFIKVHERLRLTETPMRKTKESATELEKRLEKLERRQKIWEALYPVEARKVDKMLVALGITLPETTKLTVTEKIDLIIEKQEAKQREQYRKLIEAPNNNNNH